MNFSRTTGTTYIFVGLQRYSQVWHMYLSDQEATWYLSDYNINIYTCRTSTSTLVFSPPYIFVGLTSVTLEILLRSNIYTVRLKLGIFQLQSFPMEIYEDPAMIENWRYSYISERFRSRFLSYSYMFEYSRYRVFQRNIHIYLNIL